MKNVRIRNATTGETYLELEKVRRDQQGRITTAWVVNGLWKLKTDYVKGVFWPEAYPHNSLPLNLYTGWELPKA